MAVLNRNDNLKSRTYHKQGDQQPQQKSMRPRSDSTASTFVGIPSMKTIIQNTKKVNELVKERQKVQWEAMRKKNTSTEDPQKDQNRDMMMMQYSKTIPGGQGFAGGLPVPSPASTLSRSSTQTSIIYTEDVSSSVLPRTKGGRTKREKSLHEASIGELQSLSAYKRIPCVISHRDKTTLGKATKSIQFSLADISIMHQPFPVQRPKQKKKQEEKKLKAVERKRQRNIKKKNKKKNTKGSNQKDSSQESIDEDTVGSSLEEENNIDGPPSGTSAVLQLDIDESTMSQAQRQALQAAAIGVSPRTLKYDHHTAGRPSTQSLYERHELSNEETWLKRCLVEAGRRMREGVIDLHKESLKACVFPEPELEKGPELQGAAQSKTNARQQRKSNKRSGLMGVDSLSSSHVHHHVKLDSRNENYARLSRNENYASLGRDENNSSLIDLDEYSEEEDDYSSSSFDHDGTNGVTASLDDSHHTSASSLLHKTKKKKERLSTYNAALAGLGGLFDSSPLSSNTSQQSKSKNQKNVIMGANKNRSKDESQFSTSAQSNTTTLIGASSKVGGGGVGGSSAGSFFGNILGVGVSKKKGNIDQWGCNLMHSIKSDLGIERALFSQRIKAKNTIMTENKTQHEYTGGVGGSTRYTPPDAPAMLSPLLTREDSLPHPSSQPHSSSLPHSFSQLHSSSLPHSSSARDTPSYPNIPSTPLTSSSSHYFSNTKIPTPGQSSTTRTTRTNTRSREENQQQSPALATARKLRQRAENLVLKSYPFILDLNIFDDNKLKTSLDLHWDYVGNPEFYCKILKSEQETSPRGIYGMVMEVRVMKSRLKTCQMLLKDKNRWEETFLQKQSKLYVSTRESLQSIFIERDRKKKVQWEKRQGLSSLNGSSIDNGTYSSNTAGNAATSSSHFPAPTGKDSIESIISAFLDANWAITSEHAWITKNVSDSVSGSLKGVVESLKKLQYALIADGEKTEKRWRQGLKKGYDALRKLHTVLADVDVKRRDLEVKTQVIAGLASGLDSRNRSRRVNPRAVKKIQKEMEQLRKREAVAQKNLRVS
eukprot:g263.t1